MREQAPATTNVIFLDEYPRFIEHRRTHELLGQLTLSLNTDPAQLLLFVPRESSPDDAA